MLLNTDTLSSVVYTVNSFILQKYSHIREKKEVTRKQYSPPPSHALEEGEVEEALPSRALKVLLNMN